MRRALHRHLGHLAAILVLAAIGVGTAAYILDRQGARVPLLEQAPVKIKAEFSRAGGVNPGQHQAVRIAGVRVGEIAGLDLENGRAVLTLAIDPKYARRIHRDATALLRPRTALEDMFVELDPGTAGASVVRAGDRIRIGETAPEVKSHEILNQLDTQTRAYLGLLINGGGDGLQGRGRDLRKLLRRLEPLHRDVERVSGIFARQRRKLRRLVHVYGKLTTAVAQDEDDLATVVSASNEVFGAFASQRSNVSATVAKLPAALDRTEGALARLRSFADLLGPTVQALRPPVRRLPRANAALRDLAVATTDTVRDDVRPFIRRLTPYLDSLRPAAGDLSRAAPDLDESLLEHNRFFNMAAFNPSGAEEPRDDARRDEGYLFWLAWAAHNTNNLFSTSDATGPFRRSNFAVSCDTRRRLVEVPEGGAAVEAVFSEVLDDTRLCPGGGR